MRKMSHFRHVNNCQHQPNASHRNDRFQFIEEEDLSQAVGKVRRERAKKKDFDIWSTYCTSQIEKLIPPPVRKENEDARNDFKHADKFEEITATVESDYDDFKEYKVEDDIKENQHTSIHKTEDDFAANASEYLLKTGQKRVLGYSNITLVSSHRAEYNVTERNVHPNEKLKAIRLKLKQILEVISSSLNIFRVAEDSVEMAQIQQKANEFCSRFSRNHLYQVGRHLNEITKTLNYCLPFTQWKQYATQSKNIVNLHQILYQAFSMFQRHMRIVWGFGGTQEKLHTLLQLTLEINRVCLPSQDPMDLSYSDLEHICQKLIESLNELPDDNSSSNSASLVDYEVLSPAVAVRKVKSAGSRVNHSCPHEHDRLNTPNPTKKRFESAMSGDRYSMYRSKISNRVINQNKHWNPGPQNTTTRNQVTKNKGWLKTDHIFAPNKPLNYRKYVGSNICKDQCLSIHSEATKRSASAQTLKRQKDLKKNSEMEIKITTKPNSIICDQERINTSERIVYSKHLDSKTPRGPLLTPACSHINEKDLADKLVPLLAKHFQKIYPEAAGEVGGVRKAAGRDGAGAGGRRADGNPSNLTSTKGRNNSSNVQLLILSHDDDYPLPSTSKSATDDNIKNSNTDDIAHESGKTISKSKTVHVIVGETSADMAKSRKETQRSDKKFDAAKDSHIPTRIPAVKAKMPVKLNIPEAVEDAIHKYRMDFIRHIADSPLYANSDIKRPWEVVSRISEELIEDALTTVAEELEMESLLKQMIDVELKDYSEK